MIAPVMMPSPGAAKGVVPKKGIGIAFWTAGVPGSAVMMKVKAPRAAMLAVGERDAGGDDRHLRQEPAARSSPPFE
jgi:hypothetical protein